ncbi:18640_t:CDS:2 [Acaulospora morrowiae]|uniref:18640_t:CDS:1 n=1 Tax=Acaulospora morrowiae TaxID=94023 RepID=A0A9N9A183_9GLOM|nr:18640_t:CDS:2 [Acaulospora morrowiae]
MTVLENANAGDFDNAVKCTILKSKMAGKYTSVPANDSYIVGSNFDQVSAVKLKASFSANILPTISWPETSSCQLQNKSMILVQSQQKRSNSDDYPRVSDKYMPERPSDGYGVNSERFIHADIINPIPSTSQIMKSLANDLYKKLSDMFSAKLVQSKNKDISTDDINEITKGMSKLSLNLAKMAKEFENANKDISLAKSKAKYATKLEEIKLLRNEMELLKGKLDLSQKDSSKKGSEIVSLKSKIVELVIKISELERLKSEDISGSIGSVSHDPKGRLGTQVPLFHNTACSTIIGGDDKKNIQSEEQSSITKSDDISAVIEESEI